MAALAGLRAHAPRATRRRRPRPRQPRAQAERRRPRAAQPTWRQVFGAPIASRGVWGVEIRSLDTGERLFEHDAGKLMMPASNMKILTLAAAAETLGWDYRYTTTLETTGTIENGVLHGDLVVRGTGDPTISSRSARARAACSTSGPRRWRRPASARSTAASSATIRRSTTRGSARAGRGTTCSTATPRRSARSQYNENVATLTVTPGGPPARRRSLQLDAGAGLMLLNRATTAAAGSATTVDYRRHLEQPLLEITGTVPLGAARDHPSGRGRQPDAVLRAVAEGCADRARHRRRAGRPPISTMSRRS